MNPHTLITIAQRELRDALRNKWLLFYALGFAVLGLALSQASLASAGYAGLGGFGRTSASLVNAVMLFVPLIGLTAGAGALAADRERGTLLYLLTQPVTRLEVFLGKVIGAGLAVVAAIGLGFGLAGLALSFSGTADAGSYLGMVASSLLLGMAALGLGFLISALTRKAATASGAALVAWLLLAFLGDLGVIATTLTLRPTAKALLGILLINPLQTFKVAMISTLQSGLDLLGPVGRYASYELGSALVPILIGMLVLWCVVPLTISFLIFNRKGDV